MKSNIVRVPYSDKITDFHINKSVNMKVFNKLAKLKKSFDITNEIYVGS